MSKEKTTSTTATTPTATPEETAFIAQQTKELQATQEQRLNAQNQGFDLVSSIFGGQELPGNLGQISQGISPEAISAQAQRLVGQNAAFAQAGGFLDSGVAAQEAQRQVAGELLLPSEQFNINTLLNLLNFGGGQQSSLQGQSIQQQGLLGNQLAGLRSTVTTGTLKQMNPFLKSFQTSLGSGLGGGLGGGISGGIGGAIAGDAGAGVTSGVTAGLAGGTCWVAAEIFGGWYHAKTCATRNYINNIAPKWFKKLYLKYGEEFAKFISDKAPLRLMLKPLFEYFAYRGGESWQMVK